MKQHYDGTAVARATIAQSLAKGRWVIDNDPAPQFPLYTRGNIGEVFPDVVKPFSWSLWGIPWSEKGWREALANLGAFDLEEFPSDRMAMLSVFGGYGYLNVTASRIFGVRAPGLTPEGIDQSFFGDQPDVPCYKPRPTDESATHTAKLAETIGWVMTTERLPELDAMRQEVLALRNSRPALDQMTDKQLLERTRKLTVDAWAPFWTRHIMATYHSMIPSGAVASVSAAVGLPEKAADIHTSDLAVDSALPAKALWDLSRLVNQSPVLTRAFDAGLDGLLERLRADPDPDARAFIGEWDKFLAEFGFRGTNEWEMASQVWELNPDAPLSALNSQRRASEADSPAARKLTRDAAREEAVAAVGERLASDTETLAQFQMAARAAQVFFAGRERTRANCAMVVHEMRMPMWELGRRFVERGIFERPNDFALMTNDEWDTALANPDSTREIIAARRAGEAELAALIPPFIVDGTVPDLSTWQRRGGPVEALREGESIQGVPGCAGVIRGRAIFVSDPSDPAELEPGDILLAQHTDPSWTPIFAAVSGVVVDVGATVSHAVIVARELGVPCAVSATQATVRIASGSIIEVDGATGRVTLIFGPENAGLAPSDTHAPSSAHQADPAPASLQATTPRPNDNPAPMVEGARRKPETVDAGPSVLARRRKPWWKVW